MILKIYSYLIIILFLSCSVVDQKNRNERNFEGISFDIIDLVELSNSYNVPVEFKILKIVPIKNFLSAHLIIKNISDITIALPYYSNSGSFFLSFFINNKTNYTWTQKGGIIDPSRPSIAILKQNQSIEFSNVLHAINRSDLKNGTNVLFLRYSTEKIFLSSFDGGETIKNYIIKETVNNKLAMGQIEIKTEIIIFK